MPLDVRRYAVGQRWRHVIIMILIMEALQSLQDFISIGAGRCLKVRSQDFLR